LTKISLIILKIKFKFCSNPVLAGENLEKLQVCEMHRQILKWFLIFVAPLFGGPENFRQVGISRNLVAFITTLWSLLKTIPYWDVTETKIPLKSEKSKLTHNCMTVKAMKILDNFSDHFYDESQVFIRLDRWTLNNS
jgi:hypothetical protein